MGYLNKDWTANYDVYVKGINGPVNRSIKFKAGTIISAVSTLEKLLQKEKEKTKRNIGYEITKFVITNLTRDNPY